MRWFIFFIAIIIFNTIIFTLSCGENQNKRVSSPNADSIEFYTDKIEDYPDNIYYYFKRASFYNENALKTNEFSDYEKFIDLAFEDFTKVISLQPNLADGYYFRSSLGYKYKILFLQNKIRRDYPNFSEVERRLKFFEIKNIEDDQYDLVNYKKALEDIEVAIKLEPDNRKYNDHKQSILKFIKIAEESIQSKK